MDEAMKAINIKLDDLRAALLPRLKRLAKESLNPLLINRAGSKRSPFGVMYHTGRRSGRRYAVPVLPAVRRGNTFVFSVTYGPETDW